MSTEVSDLLDEARESLAKEMRALDDLSERAIKAAKGSKKYSVQLASHVAYLAKGRAEIVSHLRQLEKHDRTMSKTPEQRFQLVLAYIRKDTTPIQRAELASVLAEMENGRSVLS